MNDSPAVTDREKLLAEWTELVDDLDRRVPSLKSAGEARVAEQAAALKRHAETRILELNAGR